MTVGEVAEFFGVSTDAVRHWTKTGKVRSFRTPGGTRRFWRADVESLIPPEPEPESQASA
jgi:excisionase family DNA binding protein